MTVRGNADGALVFEEKRQVICFKTFILTLQY